MPRSVLALALDAGCGRSGGAARHPHHDAIPPANDHFDARLGHARVEDAPPGNSPRVLAAALVVLAACRSNGTTTPSMTDRFGVAKIYPTLVGGREWTLPNDAEVSSGDWRPESGSVSSRGDGVFRTEGEAGQVRLNATSGTGEAWWRNVEMTAYFRYAGDRLEPDQERHFELLVRGEGHWDADTVPSADINGGNLAPAGTTTWPGYPFSATSVNAHCLGSSYHGNVYLDGTVVFEKELTHTEGYANWRGETRVQGFSPEAGGWFGMKLVVRNVADDERVRLELWIDAAADGTWRKATEYEDAPGLWPASSPTLDGCTAPPFSYTSGGIIDWAGPWAIFRSDSMLLDFRWLSVREIAPLP